MILIFHTRRHSSCALCCCEFLMIEWWHEHSHTHISHGREWRRRWWWTAKKSEENSHANIEKDEQDLRAFLSGMLRMRESKIFPSFYFLHAVCSLHSSSFFANHQHATSDESESVRMSSVWAFVVTSPQLNCTHYYPSSYVSCSCGFVLLFFCYYVFKRRKMASSLISRAVISDANMNSEEQSNLLISQSHPPHSSYLSVFTMTIITKVLRAHPKWSLHGSRENENETQLLGIRVEKPKQVSFIPAQHNKEENFYLTIMIIIINIIVIIASTLIVTRISFDWTRGFSSHYIVCAHGNLNEFLKLN